MYGNKRFRRSGARELLGRIVLDNDETNEALCVEDRAARVGVPGYGGFGKRSAWGRVGAPGYGTAPVTVRVLRFPHS